MNYQSSHPHKDDGEGDARTEHPKGRDAGGGKDYGVFKHGVVHDEMVVDVVGIVGSDDLLFL